MYVKQSARADLSEGLVITYVAAHTSIPVPLVVDNGTGVSDEGVRDEMSLLLTFISCSSSK